MMTWIIFYTAIQNLTTWIAGIRQRCHSHYDVIPIYLLQFFRTTSDSGRQCVVPKSRERRIAKINAKIMITTQCCTINGAAVKRQGHTTTLRIYRIWHHSFLAVPTATLANRSLTSMWLLVVEKSSSHESANNKSVRLSTVVNQFWLVDRPQEHLAGCMGVSFHSGQTSRPHRSTAAHQGIMIRWQSEHAAGHAGQCSGACAPSRFLSAFFDPVSEESGRPGDADSQRGYRAGVQELRRAGPRV